MGLWQLRRQHRTCNRARCCSGQAVIAAFAESFDPRTDADGAGMRPTSVAGVRHVPGVAECVRAMQPCCMADAAIFNRDRSRWRSTVKPRRARLHWNVPTERIADVGGLSDHIQEDARSYLTPVCSTAFLVEKVIAGRRSRSGAFMGFWE